MVLKLLKVLNSMYHLLGAWIAEEEVAKTEMLRHHGVKVNIQFLRVLVEKFHTLHRHFEVRLRRLHYHGQVFIGISHRLEEFHACLRVFNTFTWETAVADDAKEMVFIGLIHLHCLLIVAGQQHLWSASHAQHLGGSVQSLCGKVQALREDVFI